MRVLIAFEATHASHASVYEGVLRSLRPWVEVKVVGLRELRSDFFRFWPHLVVSSQPADAIRDHRAAWFRLSVDPGRPSEARLDGTAWSSTNPDLEDLLEVVDATEALVRTRRLPRRDDNV